MDQPQSPAPAAALPPLSIVMPVRNEERHLDEAVRRVLAQDYPAPVEVVLAVGPSHDRTRAIAERLAASDARIAVVYNPCGDIPAALNLAIKASRYEVIARVDGHALLPDGYLQTAVRTLQETGADGVGGVMAAEGVTSFECAVAWAMTSKFGVGSATNHTGGDAGPASTVYLGVYRRAALEKVGGYDEAYLRAEEWEMNFRIARPVACCGSSLNSRSPTGPGAVSGRWPPSTSITGGGGVWWPVSTPGPSTCATWPPRRRPPGSWSAPWPAWPA